MAEPRLIKFYVELQPDRWPAGKGRIRSVKALRLTQNPPAMPSGNAAVCIVLTVEDELFDPASVVLKVEAQRGLLAIEQRQP